MKLHFFGCSFTEGSGLNSLEYYNKKTNSNILDYTIETNQILLKFKEEHRYTNVVKNLMNCDVVNYALGGNSNENILNQLFEVLNFEKTSSGDIFIIQLSMISRKYFWYQPTEKFYNINNFDINNSPYDNKEYMKPLSNLYELYTKYSYNEEYETNKLLRDIELFNSYCAEKNIKIFWIPWAEICTTPNINDFYEKNKELENKNFIFFENLSMGTFINFKKYTISDEYPNIIDAHKSIKGHKIIGNMIVDVLNKKL